MNSRNIIKTTQGNVVPLTPNMNVRRVLPSNEIRYVNPFVFLDHMGPVVQKPSEVFKRRGTGAHPHRGFITFTYLLSGEVEHFDSQGNHGIVGEGGAQWMLAGSGIVHDEGPSEAFTKKGGKMQGLQLWINLPSKFKEMAPDYMPLPSDMVPEVKLGDNNKLRVLIGEYEDKKSSIPVFSPMFIYHIVLEANTKADISIPSGFDSFVYLPEGQVHVGGKLVEKTTLALLDKSSDFVSLENTSNQKQDIMLYGAEPLNEPIVAHGPFVMNSMEEIYTANEDFHNGKYGEIHY